MKVQYEINQEDLSAFSLYHYSHSPAARRQYLRSWLVPAFILLLVCTGIWYVVDRERGTPLRTFLDLIPLFCSVPLYLIYFPWAYRRNIRNVMARMVTEGQNRGLFCHHEVTISPDGITESNEFVQTTSAWRAVERVAHNSGYIFIYTNAVAAIIIPRRAFAASTEFDEFLRIATDYHRNAVS